MNSIKKKILAIGVAAVVVSLITVFGTRYLLSAESKIEVPGLSGQENIKYEEEIDYVDFYRINEKGEILKEKLNMKDSNDILGYIEYIFESYGTYSENDIINISSKVKVLGYETKMGTLYINLSEEIKESALRDRAVEAELYETIGKSLYPYSRKYGFQDFQILVDGQSEPRIFGFMETSHPRMVIP